MTVLKTINPILTPDLLWALAAMGHGDTLAVVDANYPAYALHSRVLPLAAADMTATMMAIGSLMPVDDAVHPAIWGMTPDENPEVIFPSHRAVARVLSDLEGHAVAVSPLPRTAFYERAKGAFAVVLTGELSSYACFLIHKGVVTSAV